MADEQTPSRRGPAWWPTSVPWVSLVARLGLAAMWLYYSVPKLGALDANVGAVKAFQILPSGLDHAFGYAQPFVEMAFGLLLILGVGTRLTAALSALMLLVYIGGIISLGARGIAINCGCGGIASEAAKGHTRYTLDVLRDVGYLVPAVWLLWKPRSPLSLDAMLLMDDDEPEPTPQRASAARSRPTGQAGAKPGGAKTGTNPQSGNPQSGTKPESNAKSGNKSRNQVRTRNAR